MPAWSLSDPNVLDLRRRRVAESPHALGLEQAALAPAAAGRWELRLDFIPKAPGAGDAVPPRLTAGNLRIVPLEAQVPVSFVIESITANDAASAIVALSHSADAASLQRLAPQWQVELVDVEGLDPLFSTAQLSLLADVPSVLPRALAPQPQAPPPVKPPEIDYLAKDYAGFRREMLDDLAAWVPGLIENSVAGEDMAVVELLAFAGDYLSYYQDAVGTEAYLGTARERVSVARHAQLLDYWLAEGTSSRVWAVIATRDVPAGGAVLPQGTVLLSAVGQLPPVITTLAEYDQAVSAGASVFATLEDLAVHAELGSIELYDWDLPELTLEPGSVEAALGLQHPALIPGRVLLLAERDGPRAHAVRLSAAEAGVDPVTGRRITMVRWSPEDALPFPLPVVRRSSGRTILALARGNVVLADFGAPYPAAGAGARPWAPLRPVPPLAPYRPPLPAPGLVFAEPFEPAAAQGLSAAKTLRQDPQRAMPDVDLRQETLDGGLVQWTVRRNLFASGRFAPDYVVEMGEQGAASLLFGNGWQGQRPAPGSRFAVRFRVAAGTANIGSQALGHVLTDRPWVAGVSNPQPAVGATPPERTQRAVLFAPRAYKTQERCVVPADYQAALSLHPEVLHTAVQLQSSGGGQTAFVYVQLRGGRRLDPATRADLAATLQPRMSMGTGFQVLDAVYLAVFAEFLIEVARDAAAAVVEQSLFAAFKVFFAPARFTFGQPLYLSRMLEQAMAVPGVAAVVPQRFTTWGSTPGSELAAGVIVPADRQIVELRNDPDRPEDGTLTFSMWGGS